MSDLRPEASSRRLNWRLISLLVATTGLAAAILAHAPGLDGPWYSHWGWRRTPARFVYPAMLGAAIPLLVALLLHDLRRIRPVALLPLVALSHGLFQLIAISLLGAAGYSLDAYIKAVVHPDALSYFADAAALVGGGGTVRDWLSQYPDLLPQLFLHSKTKPPGPVMFFAGFIATLGLERSTALIAGLAVAVVAMLVAPAVYFLCRSLTMSAGASFYASAWSILTPSAVMFLPSLDAWWMISTCLFVGCWAHALRSNRFGWSIAFGAALMVTTFFVYNILVIGATLVGYAVLCADIPAGKRVLRFVRHSAVAIASLLGCYALLALLTGFNPLATFIAAYRVQESLPGEFNRAYRWTILFDQTDFALGAGWLALLVVGMYVARFCVRRVDQCGIHHGATEDMERSVGNTEQKIKSSPPRSPWLRGEIDSSKTIDDGPGRCFAWLAIGQILLTGFTGLLPGETARVWAFLVPLLMPMVGGELFRWSRTTRWIAFACAWLILALLIQNLLAANFEEMPLV